MDAFPFEIRLHIKDLRSVVASPNQVGVDGLSRAFYRIEAPLFAFDVSIARFFALQHKKRDNLLILRELRSVFRGGRTIVSVNGRSEDMSEVELVSDDLIPDLPDRSRRTILTAMKFLRDTILVSQVAPVSSKGSDSDREEDLTSETSSVGSESYTENALSDEECDQPPHPVSGRSQTLTSPHRQELFRRLDRAPPISGPLPSFRFSDLLPGQKSHDVSAHRQAIERLVRNPEDDGYGSEQMRRCFKAWSKIGHRWGRKQGPAQDEPTKTRLIGLLPNGQQDYTEDVYYKYFSMNLWFWAITSVSEQESYKLFDWLLQQNGVPMQRRT